MLIGKSYNNLDGQRRLTIPKSMRQTLGDQAILTRGLDGGLFLFPQPKWLSLVNKLENQPFTKKQTRDFWRVMTNHAYPVSLDNLGRLTVPEDLAVMAGLTKNVVVVGSLQYIEIWEREQYHTYLDNLDQQAETIAESIEWPTI
jgi:MraZ protein